MPLCSRIEEVVTLRRRGTEVPGLQCYGVVSGTRRRRLIARPARSRPRASSS
jgi:hypothetical protein